MLLSDWYKQAKQSKLVYYTTDHITRDGMGGWYNLFIVQDGRIIRAWPNAPVEGGWSYDDKLAKKLGFRITKARRGWYRGGCGFDRVRDIFESIALQYEADRSSAYRTMTDVSFESLNID